MILFGASGHAKVILDILIQNGISVEVIYDAVPPGDHLFGIPVLADVRHTPFSTDTKAIIAIGSNKVRKNIAESRQLHYISALHPLSCVSPFAEIGEGTVMMSHATVNPGTVIGKHGIINTGAVVEHDCQLGDYVHISPNAALAGDVHVGEGTHIGIGSSVIQGIKIGKWCTIGAGAVIIRDVPDGATVVGNPGRIIKMKDLQSQSL